MTQQAVGAKVGLAQKAVSKWELAPGTAGVQQIFKMLAALDLERVVRPRRGTPSQSEWQPTGRPPRSGFQEAP